MDNWSNSTADNLSSTTTSTPLLIIGDSIPLGAAEVRGSYIVEYVQPTCVDLLKAAMPSLDVRIDAEVYRNSVSVKQELEAIVARHQPRRVLLMIGGSDADMDWKRFVISDGKIARSRVAAEKYEANLRLICARLMEIGASIILTDCPNHCFALKGPYVAKLTGKDIPALLEAGGGQAESDKHLVPYRARVAAVAKDLNLQLIRFGEALDAEPAEVVLCADGTHPSAAGHRVIAACLIAALSQPVAAVELSA
jgi:lysophospholipase L1-like esterase